MRSSLVVAVLAVAGACYRDAPPSRPAAPPPPPAARAARFAADPLAFLPVDAEIVARLDAAQLRRSPAWQRVEPQLLAKIAGPLDAIRRACGFDPVTSIRSLTLAMTKVETADETTVVVARGLDRAALMACAERSGDVALADGVLVSARQGGDPPVVASFADATTFVLLSGPQASPAALRDLLAAGAPLRSSPAFTELFARLEHRRALWFAVNGNGTLFDKAAALGFRPHAVAGAFDVADGLDATVRVRLESPDAAQQLAAMVQGQLGPVQGFATRIEATADERDLVVVVALSPAQLDTVVTLLGGSFGGP